MARRSKAPSVGYVVLVPDGRVAHGFLYPHKEPEPEPSPDRARVSEGCYVLLGEWSRPFLWLSEAAAGHVARIIGGYVIIVDRDRDGPFGPVSGIAG